MYKQITNVVNYTPSHFQTLLCDVPLWIISYTKNRAFIKTCSVSQAVECLPNQQGSEKTGLEPAASACDGLSEAARPRSQPPLSGKFLGQGQQWRGKEDLIQPRLLNVYFIAWVWGTEKSTHLILLCCKWTNLFSETNLLQIKCWFEPNMLIRCFYKKNKKPKSSEPLVFGSHVNLCAVY